MDYCQVSQPNSRGVRESFQAVSPKCHPKNSLEENVSSLINLWSNSADSWFVIYLMIVSIFWVSYLSWKRRCLPFSPEIWKKRSWERDIWNSLKIKPDKSLSCYYLFFYFYCFDGFWIFELVYSFLGLFSRRWTSLYLKTKYKFKKLHFFIRHLWNEDRHF